MATEWKTKLIALEGGLVLNQAPLVQGIGAPGSAITAQNYEPSLSGGVRRVSGYAAYDPDPVPGTGKVLGVFVFNDLVVACRGTKIAKSGGAGWTEIQPAARTGAGLYRGTTYAWVQPTLVLVDGVNRPVKYDGTTAVELTAAPLGASTVTEHRSHLFFGKGSILTFSEPANDLEYSGTDGAGEINIGSAIVALASWRGDLFIFCRTAIYRLTGSSQADFKLEPVTKRLGCLAGASVQEIGGDLVYLAADGLRTVAGTDKVGDVELASISRSVQPRIAELVAINGMVSSATVRAKSQYRLFFATDTTAPGSARGLLGGLRGGGDAVAWEWFDLVGIRATCAHSDYLSAGTELVVHGDLDGKVYRQETGSTFGGAAVTSLLQIPHLSFDDPAIRKTLYQLRANIAVEGELALSLATVHDFGTLDPQPPVLTLTTDGQGAALYDAGTSLYDDTPADQYDRSGNPMFRVSLQGSGFTTSLIFFATDSNAPHSIKTLTLEYSLGDRA